MTTFTMPDLGEGLQEAEIVSWHVSPGDHIVADQPLVSVETDKAVVEVPSPWSGTVRKLLADAGAIVPVGEALAEIETQEASEDAGAIVGTLPQAQTGGASRRAEPETRDSPRARATPAVRKLASERGVDLAGVVGTGPGGAITRKDVETAAGGSDSLPGWEPLRGVRRAMARNMAEAHAQIALTTVTDDADITGWKAGEDITIRLARAIAAACAKEPALNAWYDGQSLARRIHDRVDLGIAVDTQDGLFVPVLRDVGNREPDDLRAGLERMREDVRNRSIPPEELRGPTITLSNFGMIGGRHAVMAVVPPQVAIIGAGRVSAAPRFVDGKVVERRILPLSLSFDHRAVNGGEAARFLVSVIILLEGRPDG